MEAYNQVLQYVGCNNYRDVLDELIINDVKNRKATYTASGNLPGYINKPEEVTVLGSTVWPVLSKDSQRGITDTDGDGIPDEWETEYGLNLKDKSDGNKKTIDTGGKYTNLEMYLNSLVHDIIKKQNILINR